ncbi:MAG TPA: rhamnulokinase family protein [Candidatus Kryptonia bacterium]
MKKYLAFDFGADSGRAILGIVSGGKVRLEEVHRFPNRQITIDGHLHWDAAYLLDELKKGLSLAVKQGHADISSVGIDSWGVDFAIVGEDGRLIEQPYSYRDSRTNGMMEQVFKKISKAEIYSCTGIQFMQINSIYQLYSEFCDNPARLNSSVTLLFMADLFNYFLTGKKLSEYTIASTSQLLNVHEKRWDSKIFSSLGLPIGIMAPIVDPGTILGPLARELGRESGLGEDVNVVAVGCHDTASAVAAVPATGDDWAFLSSGTWSIIGTELDHPNVSEEALRDDFTNEGGVRNRIRFVRNVMGMWLLQELRRNWKVEGKDYSYDELSNMAEHARRIGSVIDPEDMSFLNPPYMAAVVRDYCKKTHQRIPQTDEEIVFCVLHSLAIKYSSTLQKMRCITGRKTSRLHIVGGGSRNDLLNQMTADACGIPVTAGPAEATALGNIMVQAMADGEVESLDEARRIVGESFPVKVFKPAGRYKEKGYG